MSQQIAKHRSFAVFCCMVLSITMLSTIAFFIVQPARVSRAATPSYNWQQLKIGGGGFVTGIVIHPTVAGLSYIRTDVGGVYKLGANDTWQQLITTASVPNPAGTSDYNVESIALSQSNAQTLYIAVGNDINSQSGRILKSTNQGQSFTDDGQRWTIAGNGDYRMGGERLAVDPNNDNIVYFGSRKEGLWVTTDAGTTWTQVSTSLIPVGSTSSGTPSGDEFVVFDPTNGTTNGKTNRIYVGVAGSGVYMTNDAGVTWSNVISSTLIPYDASLASDGTLYVSLNAPSGSGALVKYSPSTSTVTTISPSTSGNGYQVAVDPANPQRVIVGTGGVSNGNVWRTTNGGSTWSTLNISISSPTIPWIANTDESNFMTSARFLFDPHASDKLWFAQGTGVWYATNNTGSTINWNFYSQGIEETVTTDLVAPPGGVPISNIYDRQGFYHADVNSYPTKPLVDSVFWGGTSLDYSGGTPGTVVTVQAKNNYYPSLTGRGATSTDGGKTWSLFGSAPANAVGGNIAISATSTSNLVWQPSTGTMGQGMAPSYSTNGGKTWTQSAGIADPVDTHWLFWWASKRALSSDKVNNAFYEITFSTTSSPTGTFYSSTDGGKTFVQAANSPACSTNDDCHVFGQLHAAPGYAGHVWSSAAKDGLWYTTNAGQSAWTKVSAVQEARAFGFGKPLPGYSYPAIYMYGKANGDTSFGIYRSPDQGATWTLLSSAPLGIYDSVNAVNGDMNIVGRVYVGFGGNGFAYGDDQNLSTGPTPTPTSTSTPTSTPVSNTLPAPWMQQDIGQVGLTGSSSYSNGSFTVAGSGTDIWGKNDAFQYAYQPLTGDGTIIAHVASQQNTNAWAKAGVMIRETLNADAKNAFMTLTPANGALFQWRSHTTGTSLNTAGPHVAAPYWVKLTRIGTTFTGFVSSDGVNWTQVDSRSISMASSVYIGLAVTACNNTVLNTSVFDQVSVS